MSFNYSHADLSGTVGAHIGGGAHVTTDHDIDVLAASVNTGFAEGLGVTVGGIAIGGMVTTVNAGSAPGIEVVSGLDAGAHIDNARFVSITASNGNDLSAESQSAGGGAITVTGSDASVSSDQDAQVLVGIGATINAQSAALQSINGTSQDLKSESLAFGLAAGGGALAHDTATGDARVDVGASAQITAKNIYVAAKNTFDKSKYPVSLQSASASLGKARSRRPGVFTGLPSSRTRRPSPTLAAA